MPSSQIIPNPDHHNYLNPPVSNIIKFRGFLVDLFTEVVNNLDLEFGINSRILLPITVVIII